MPKGQRKYSQEFKEQAISLVTERGYTHAEAAKDLGVSLHTLKYWLKAARKNGAGQITPEGEEYHTRSHGIYGYRKVAEDVRREAGISCCNETVRVLMKERGLCAKTRRKFVRTTVSDDTHPHAENILNRAFSAGEANQKWTADITYIATAEGWLYLAAVMDLYSRRIVGWSMSESIDAGLVCRALQAAYELRRPAAGLIHHSDRGVQYTSAAYQSLLSRYGMICSMSRKGNCWDNAGQKNFFGNLKAEWVGCTAYRSREEARKYLFDYIEVFYNNQRRHKALGYVAPEECELRGNNKGTA